MGGRRVLLMNGGRAAGGSGKQQLAGWQLLTAWHHSLHGPSRVGPHVGALCGCAKRAHVDSWHDAAHATNSAHARRCRS